jgi:hypothetical protein
MNDVNSMVWILAFIMLLAALSYLQPALFSNLATAPTTSSSESCAAIRNGHQRLCNHSDLWLFANVGRGMANLQCKRRAIV